jgi:hypothetical protein
MPAIKRAMEAKGKHSGYDEFALGVWSAGRCCRHHRNRAGGAADRMTI